MERNTVAYSCIVPSCESAYRGKIDRSRRFFRLPSNESYRSKWLFNLGLKGAYKSARVCDLHFDTKYFTSTLRHRLIKFAVPKLLDPSEYSASAVHPSSEGSNSSPSEVVTLMSDNDLASQLEDTQSSFSISYDNGQTDHSENKMKADNDEAEDKNEKDDEDIQNEEEIQEHEAVYFEIEGDNETIEEVHEVVINNEDKHEELVIGNSQVEEIEEKPDKYDCAQEVDDSEPISKKSKLLQYKIVLPILENTNEEEECATISDEFEETQISDTGVIVFDAKTKKKTIKQLKSVNPRNDIIKIQQQTIKEMRNEIILLRNKVKILHQSLKTLHNQSNNSKT